MSVHPIAQRLDPRPLRRAPTSFTLSTALAWLGHDCPGDCPALTATCPAEIWFTRRGDTRDAWASAIVDVDFTAAPDGHGRDLLGEINDCVRPDRIRVRDRSAFKRSRFPTDFSRALAPRTHQLDR